MVDIDDFCPVTNLAGERMLHTNRGRWHERLDGPLHDTVDLDSEADLDLRELDWLISAGLDELHAHRLPTAVVHEIEPDYVPDRREFASWLAGYRAERLFQWTELTAAALEGLAEGSTQVAALTSRALLEIAGHDSALHRQVLREWGYWDQPVSAAEQELVARVRKLRFGTRDSRADPRLPEANHAMGGLKTLGGRKFGEQTRRLYDLLCEATHPNSEAHGTYWRRGTPSLGQPTIELAPGRSETPIKMFALRGVLISSVTTIGLCRDLWRAITALSFDGASNARSEHDRLGLPAAGGRNEACPCGAGANQKSCVHPPNNPFLPPSVQKGDPFWPGVTA